MHGRSRAALAAGLMIVGAAVWAAQATPPRISFRPAAATTAVRGIYRFSTTSWTGLAGDGFNWVTDGGTNTNNYAGQRAAGLTGMVYLNAYDNTACTQTMSDSAITSVVQTNVTGGNTGARYQVGDEPTANGCPAAATYSHITALIHATDPTARTWVADDQFNDPDIANWPGPGIPMQGSVDILAFDIYPCVNYPTAHDCHYDMIDGAVTRIHSAGLSDWEFILQDFGPCQSWVAPTSSELSQQFAHWQGAGAAGYWVYAYDQDPTPCAGNVTGDAELRSLNATPLNPSPTPGPTPGAGEGGYSILTSFGGIYSFGDAQYHGNLIDHGYPGPAIGLAETPNGGGYNILTTFGGIYSFGNASYHGDLIDHGYPGPAVALSATPSGGGYAILTSFGGIYTFGDAEYFGNLLDHGYPGPAVGLAYTPTGKGYSILTASGGIYSFGDARYLGNLLDHGYPGPAVSLAYTPSGNGYSILTSFGGIYSFGDATYLGNLIDHGYPGPAVALCFTP